MTFIVYPLIYVLEHDFVYNIKHHLPDDWNAGYAFIEKNGARLLEIHPNGDLKIFAQYTWDGCTPKIAVFDILIGVPEGVPSKATGKPKTYYASLVHDALNQFMEVNPDLPKSKINKIFFELLANEKFALRHLYYFFVGVLGGLSHRITKWLRGYDGKRVPL